jgi:hypothetical protein
MAIHRRRIRGGVPGRVRDAKELDMIGPLPLSLPAGSAARSRLAFGVGIGFGMVLERAGLGSATKLMGQFHLTDMAVFKVMFSAIVTAMLGLFWLSRLGAVDLSRVYVPETFVLPQLVGGLVFGAGMALAGLCPGTSCVAAATGAGTASSWSADSSPACWRRGSRCPRWRGSMEAARAERDRSTRRSEWTSDR